jgi:hypothetical protein
MNQVNVPAQQFRERAFDRCSTSFDKFVSSGMPGFEYGRKSALKTASSSKTSDLAVGDTDVQKSGGQ